VDEAPPVIVSMLEINGVGSPNSRLVFRVQENVRRLRQPIVLQL